MMRFPADPTQAIEDLKPVMAELLRVAMMVRKNMIANEGRHYVEEQWAEAYNGEYPTTEQVETLLTNIFPWVWGPRSIMPLLIAINTAYDRGQVPQGMSIYNVLNIVHNLDRSGIIRIGYEMMYTSKKRYLPEPEMWMATVGL